MNPSQAYWNAINAGNVDRDTLDDLNRARVDHELTASARRELGIGHYLAHKQNAELDAQGIADGWAVASE